MRAVPLEPGRRGSRDVVASKASAFLVATALLAALVFGVTLAQGAKQVVNYFGSGPGTLGGQFDQPRDVAVNEVGSGAAVVGDIYVADDNNHRIQVFDADGDFKFAFGRDVVAPDSQDVFEKCTVAADCKAGVAGTSEGMFDNPQGVAINQATGDLYVRDRDNRRVQQFDAAGTFVRAWGFGVDDGTTGAFQVCTSTCFAGLAGNGVGQFGNSVATGGGIAVAPQGAPNAGDVFVVDPASTGRRVQRFNADGTLDAAPTIGSSGNFGINQPVHVAADAAGIVYASDSNSSGQIDRYDTNTSTFMTSIAVPPLLAGVTSGLEVDPDSDGAGTDEDVLLVLRDPSSGATVVQQFGPSPTSDPGAATAPTTVHDTHGAGAGFTSVNGLGSDSASGRLMVSSASSTVGTPFGHRIFLLGDAPPPTATIESVDAGSTSATIEGTVDANGAQSGYHVEISTDGGATWMPRPSGADIPVGAGDDPEAVSYEVDGLEPGVEYDVRIVAKQIFGTASGASGVDTFTTDSAPPVVNPQTDADVGATSAVLTGSVDPSGEATTYRFEYGLTDEYGEAAPVPDGDLAAGSGAKPVTATLSSLEPSTTYHYRLIATNATGTAEGEDHVFTTTAEPGDGSCPNAAVRTGASERLPGCRAYEQVSPVDKNGGDIMWDINQPDGAGAVAAGGERVVLFAQTEFAGVPQGGSLENTFYLAKRGGDGWTTKGIAGRVTPGGASRILAVSSRDLGQSLLTSTGVMESNPPDTTPDVENIYRRDNEGEIISPILGLGSGDVRFRFPAPTPQVDTMAFASSLALTADPDPGPFVVKVYQWRPGSLQLVSVQPDGSPFQSSSFPGGTSVNPTLPASLVGAVSDDGQDVFFNANGSIYRRSGGATTVLASPSKRSLPDPVGARPKQFYIGSADGERVFFTSSEHLTDDANTGPSRSGTDLYRYDVDADELIDISATDGGNGAGVLGVAGADREGHRVYYVATGVVTTGAEPGDPDPVAGQPNLYLWEDDGTQDGTTRFIATLTSPADRSSWFEINGHTTARVTGDGKTIVFESSAAIPGHDNGAARQVYRYDVSEDGGAGELACVSCDPAGGAAIGPASLPIHNGIDNSQPWELHALSEDGDRVFFTSQDSLIARDTNGKLDAYMWEDGEIHLLSSGTNPRDARVFNASASGDDVFILTADKLVPQDKDDLIDLYDARVGGGFPAPEPDPDCSGDDCQGGGSIPPAAPGAGSDDISGPGDLQPPPRLTLAARRPSAGQLRRLAAGRFIGLRVQVSRAAVVRARVRAGLGGRLRTVARGSRRARRAGVVTIRLRLNRQARRRLDRGRAMRLSIRLSAAGARPDSLTLRIGGNR